jgi:hypothetical protein
MGQAPDQRESRQDARCGRYLRAGSPAGFAALFGSTRPDDGACDGEAADRAQQADFDDGEIAGEKADGEGDREITRRGRRSSTEEGRKPSACPVQGIPSNMRSRMAIRIGTEAGLWCRLRSGGCRMRCRASRSAEEG